MDKGMPGRYDSLFQSIQSRMYKVTRTKWTRLGVVKDKPKAVIDQVIAILFWHSKEGIQSDTIQVWTPGR